MAGILMAAITSEAQDMDHAQHKQKESQHDTLKHSVMTSQFSLDLPMNRDGSGTSWVPDETPMFMYMLKGKKWMQMVHGSIFARYNKQDVFEKGNRGGSKFDSPSWFMYMAQLRTGKTGLFSVNTMLSLDPFLIGLNGYPLLYQTGESYKGRKLSDRQHPHDLFDQLSVAYTQRVAKYTDVSLSVGYPGEPALGPPVFMHRLSAMNNPDAPLSHHYSDATHITFGTATFGLRHKNMKLEGSVFTGREPDEFRYGFDQAKFDSYSLRLSVNPSREWALQVSNGWLKNPEETELQENINRFTASAIHMKMLNAKNYVSTTLVYGQNTHDGHTEPGALLESTLQLNKMAIYGRYEYVEKSAESLNLTTKYPDNPNFEIQSLTLGTNRILATIKQTTLTAGLQASVNFSPAALRNQYGKNPVGFQVYLRITPSLLKSGGKHQMEMASEGNKHPAVFTQFEDTTNNRAPTVRFQRMKSNAKLLSAGESKANLMIYFKKYLELKDKMKADSIATAILELDDSPEIKYQLSLTYYQFVGITETHRLFLSAGNDIKTNHNYLLHRKTTEIKGQRNLVWARFYNLVQLDSVYYQENKSDSIRLQMSERMNSLAWNSLLTGQPGRARYYLDKSLKLNPLSKNYLVNQPHVLLFNGDYKNAKKWYLKYKDLPFDNDYPKYKDVFLEDFLEFKKAGLTNSHIAELTALLDKL